MALVRDIFKGVMGSVLIGSLAFNLYAKDAKPSKDCIKYAGLATAVLNGYDLKSATKDDINELFEDIDGFSKEEVPCILENMKWGDIDFSGADKEVIDYLIEKAEGEGITLQEEQKKHIYDSIEGKVSTDKKESSTKKQPKKTKSFKRAAIRAIKEDSTSREEVKSSLGAGKYEGLSGGVDALISYLAVNGESGRLAGLHTYFGGYLGKTMVPLNLGVEGTFAWRDLDNAKVMYDVGPFVEFMTYKEDKDFGIGIKAAIGYARYQGEKADYDFFSTGLGFSVYFDKFPNEKFGANGSTEIKVLPGAGGCPIIIMAKAGIRF